MRVTLGCGIAAIVLLLAAACSDSDPHPLDDAGKAKATVGRPKATHTKSKDGGAGDSDAEASSREDRDEDAGGSGGNDVAPPARGDKDAGGGANGDTATDPDPEPTPDTEDAGTTPVIDAGSPLIPYTMKITYDGDPPPDDKLPKAKGECPEFAGYDEYTFDVQGGRKVVIGVDASKAPKKGPGGPVIFYWHGTGGSPFEAGYGLGDAVINEVMNQGGLVAGFYSTMNWPDKGECEECRSNTGNGVWFIEDFNLADEVLACAIDQLHIDTRRIHASGMSAGGLQASAMLYARSNYMASVAPYSGGVLAPRRMQDPSNNVAAMIFHGTYDDDVVGLHFYSTSKTLFNDVVERGGFAIDCNHGGAHIIPADGGPAAWLFFELHPYRTEPSPWATMLPKGLPKYCSLTFQDDP